MMLYVEDVDATAKRAVDAGAKLVRPIEDQFYGDRAGGLEDPFGHYWHVATHIEDVSAEEIRAPGGGAVFIEGFTRLTDAHPLALKPAPRPPARGADSCSAASARPA